MKMISNYLSKRRIGAIFFAAMILVFILVRIPGLSLPYHQDEWKTAWGIVQGASGLAGLYHPPLTQLFWQLDGLLFGVMNLRVFPFLFSILTAVLLFIVVKKRAGLGAAYFSLGLFTITSYSVLASLMLDTDGAILPLFFLLSVYAYDKWRESEIKSDKWIWFGALLLALVLGFLVKLSFILAVGAIAIDYVFNRYKTITKKEILIGVLSIIGFFALALLLIIIARAVYPTFRIDGMISHAVSYARIGGRNYLQVIIQALKSVYYLSPVLLIPLIFLNSEIFKKMRIFFIYILCALIFYFILFDFSSGALDKYLMFSIVPLSAIVGAICAAVLRESRFGRVGVALGALISGGLLFLNFMPHAIVPLNPKAEWFSKVTHFKWNFLNPFTGGNGPLGFYVSFLFIAVSFIVSLIVGVIGRTKKKWRSGVLAIIILISLSYNGVFIEEMLFGKINGSAPSLLRETLAFLKTESNSPKVITYNDTGAFELNRMGMYAGRFYAVPEYAEAHKKLFKDFKGLFLVIDIPHINEDIFHGRFIAACGRIFGKKSGVVDAGVYSCQHVPNAILK